MIKSPVYNYQLVQGSVLKNLFHRKYEVIIVFLLKVNKYEQDLRK